MNQIKTGQFIAGLRRKAGLTQEKLGERLGVTNKTVSRWENGNYMPDIETLQLISKEFSVSINELLAGEFLTDEEFRKKADENLIDVSRESAFSIKEKQAYFKKKWRKDHCGLLVILILIFLAAVILPFVFRKSYLAGIAPAIGLLVYGWQNNRMMVYVENKVFGELH